jgi:hypothetical protein
MKNKKVKKYDSLKKFKPLIFIFVFALLGGSYLLYKSFAATPITTINVAQKGVIGPNASTVTGSNGVTKISLRPGATVSLKLPPLKTATYRFCLKMRATSNVDKTLSLLNLDADNSNDAKEQANRYSEYSIRIKRKSMKVPYFSAPQIDDPETCRGFNYAVYGMDWKAYKTFVDYNNAKAPKLYFNTPTTNKTNIEIETIVLTQK